MLSLAQAHTTHKLDAKSKPCVFVGYSPTQSAYYFLDLATHHIFVSRHVHFVEDKFPFSSQNSPPPSMSTLLEEWAPLSLSIMSHPPSSTQPDTTNPTPPQTPTPPHTPATSSAATSPSPTHTDSHSTEESVDHIEPPPPTHTMITRLCDGIRKQITKLNLHAEVVDKEFPRNITQALKSQVWRKAMDAEIHALVSNKTWDLVPPPSSQNVVGCKWIFRIKNDKDGNISQYKARYVGRGFNQ